MKPIVELDDADLSPRQNVRIEPHKEDPVRLSLDGIEVRLINLSVMGAAFIYSGELKRTEYPVRLTFTTNRQHVIDTSIQLVRSSRPEYAGQFQGLTLRDETLITAFIVRCQKRAIRRQNEISEKNI
jgi:hypothetical protein